MQDKVRHVEEIFMDYSPVNGDLYSLDLGSTINLTKTHWDMSESLLQEQKALYQRMTDGLYAIFMSLRNIPYIRYLSKSTACQRLASSINVIFDRIKIAWNNFFMVYDKNFSILFIEINQKSKKYNVFNLIKFDKNWIM